MKLLGYEIKKLLWAIIAGVMVSNPAQVVRATGRFIAKVRFLGTLMALGPGVTI